MKISRKIYRDYVYKDKEILRAQYDPELEFYTTIKSGDIEKAKELCLAKISVVHRNPPVPGGHNPAILHASQLFRQPVQNNSGRNLAVPAGGHLLEFRFPVLPENADF